MRFPHLFEFMDQEWLPFGLRTTLREILECGNSRPFRPYYEWVTDELIKASKEGGFTTLVEEGAGTAPVTRHIAADPRSKDLRLVICDLNPDRKAYDALQRQYPERVFPRYDSVDFT